MSIVRRFVSAGRVVAAALVLVTPAGAGTPGEPAATFSAKCSSCHTYGRGDAVGPDLKGVTARHTRPWLVSWIRSSERMIRAGDAAAVSLFRRYRQERMPDHQLSDSQIHGLLDYLAAGGPEADSQKSLRMASTAGAAEIKLGSDLFFGRSSMANGGVACAACHSIRVQPGLAGGSLAPDLTRVYSKYQDKELSQHLDRLCLPQLAASTGRGALADDESFAIRAFLRYADLRQAQPDGVAATSDAGRNDGR